ncbi:MAG: enoyl-CoA hydratase-related protein, partial [Pseudomonadales bacterium]
MSGDLQRMSLEFQDNVAVLKFNHPEVLNAVGSQMLVDFGSAIRQIADPRNGARALLLTGEGRAFCAGANLQDENRGERGGAGDGLRSTYHPILFALRDLDMPIVTAVNGAAAGV